MYLTLIPFQNDDPSEHGRLLGLSLVSVLASLKPHASCRQSALPCALAPPLPVRFPIWLVVLVPSLA
jgi:hypothetical protein